MADNTRLVIVLRWTTTSAHQISALPYSVKPFKKGAPLTASEEIVSSREERQKKEIVQSTL